MQDRIFYATCFGFVFGVLLRSFVSVNVFTVLFIFLISIILVLFFGFISKNKWGIVAGIFVLTFSLGILRFHLIDSPAPAFFESQVDEKISFSGEIVDEPDIRENSQKLTVETGTRKEKTKILITVSFGENFKYGDEINVSGKLEKPKNFITD